MREFKVGDKVRLNPKRVTQSKLDDYGSEGKFGQVYIIHRTEGGGITDVKFKGNNWHNQEWLQHVNNKIQVGGLI